MRVLNGLIFVFVFLLGLSFAVKNNQDITIYYYAGFEWTGSLYLILAIALLIGVLLGVIVMLFYSVKSKRQLSRVRRELTKIEKEVENLRKLPITEEV